MKNLYIIEFHIFGSEIPIIKDNLWCKRDDLIYYQKKTG